MADHHLSCLKKLCRVCESLLTKDIFYVEDNKTRLLDFFYINVENDCSMIHPDKLCLKCYSRLKKVESRKSTTPHQIIDWKPHITNDCHVCTHFKSLQKGGRPKKRKATGRPSLKPKTWSRSDSTGLFTLIPPDNHKRVNINQYQSDDFLPLAICPVCNEIFSKPIQNIKCQHIVCLNCLIGRTEGVPLVDCRCPVTDCQITINPDIFIFSKTTADVIERLQLKCAQGCGKTFKSINEQEKNNHESTCLGLVINSSPTINEIFSIDTQQPVPREFEEAAAHVIKTKLAQSNDKSISFNTGGSRPLVLTSTPKGTKTDVCQRTIRRRTQFLKDQISLTTCGSMVQQTAHLISSFGADEKEKIVQKSEITRTLSAETVIALKADLGIPWEKLRKLSRWMRDNHIKMASEKKQRVVAKSWTGDDIVVQDAPFEFAIKDRKGKYEIKEAPWGYIDHLPEHVLSYLNSLDECSMFVEKATSNNEIHIKVGGDHGGKSFKMSYQCCNTKHPNSKSNTVVFNIFEAKDRRINLKMTLDRFKDQIDELQAMKWRDRNMRVFIFGDYEFLGTMYGISGASGRHCCLLCLSTYAEIQKPKNERQNTAVRTLASLKEDLKRFRDAGDDVKLAKFYNNVIDDAILNIPLDQIGIPALHIGLGSYLKIYVGLEDDNHILGMKLLGELAIKNKTLNREELDQHIQSLRKIKDLERRAQDTHDKICLVQEAISAAIVKDPENEKHIRSVYEPRIVHLQRILQERLQEIEELEKSISKLDRNSSPIVKKMDKVLNSLGVARQAYHGKSFIGNDVHKMLKDKSILALCNSIPLLVCEMGFVGTDLHRESLEICRKYKLVFHKYGKCHRLMNSSIYFDDAKIKELEIAIEDFMSFYRNNFQNLSVTIKLHLLEEHVLPFIKKWRIGLGMYGEQGAESIHPEFNQLRKVYAPVKPDTRRLKLMLEMHHMKVKPIVKTIVPIIKRRKVRHED